MYITERLTINNVTGNSVAGGTTTAFDTDLVAANGTYDGLEIEFTSGPCKGQQATILTYLQASGAIVLVTADALTRTPGADAFIIWTVVNLAAGGLGSTVNLDLPIKSRWCKIVYVKIVQLTPGAMEVDLEIWESTATRADPANRANFYQQIYTRRMSLTAVQGGQVGESLAGDPMPYIDRDAETEERDHFLHIRLENFAGGTASEFQLSIKVADMGENV